ncbi:MAG: folylpolyglutamate synthase/dihydrofolate synthase family protein [Chloroflexota bacterium]|nr:folylpolyglutamate synthase/dihydrofolate synthase family protein [Chloroflexota bacterium]
MTTDYQTALDYIFNYVDYERRRAVPYDEEAWDLDRTRRALRMLGNPQQQFKVVHVAGSKGKGSSAANIESVLRASGLRTGFYTSPHLHTFRERIRIDGNLLEPAQMVNLLDQCRPVIEAIPGITTFEIITVLAFLHFARQGVEWAVLEVGLGGRLDSTNVVTPAVSVITPISHEHSALLGDTLAAIAFEKAGIIKKGVPVVCAPQDPEVLLVFQQVAAQQDSSLVLVGLDWRWRSITDDLGGQSFSVFGPHPAEPGAEPVTIRSLYTPLLGRHQLINATVAVATCWELMQQGVEISEPALREGLSTVYWPGRLEVLDPPGDAGPAVVVDSAHNEASTALLFHALGRYLPGRPLVVLFGASGDKDAAAMLERFAPHTSKLVLTRSRHPRAADPEQLAAAARAYLAAESIFVTCDVAEGLNCALQVASPASTVCATGSLFVVADSREAWLARYPGAFPPWDWAYQAEPPDPDWQVSQSPASRVQ